MPAGRWWAIRLGMVAEDDADAPAREEPRQAFLAVAKGESAEIPRGSAGASSFSIAPRLGPQEGPSND